MRVLGISFSGREDGNCGYCLDYCLKQFRGNEAAVIHIQPRPPLRRLGI